MPSKPIDTSQDWSFHDFAEFTPLDDEDILRISSNFKIADHDSFEHILRAWSAYYRNGVRAYRDVPSWKKRHALFQELAKATTRTITAFDALGSSTLSTLRRIPESGLKSVTRDGRGHPLINVYRPAVEAIPAEFALDLDLIHEALRLLKSRASHFEAYYSKLPEGMENQPPLRDMARRVLIHNIADYWSREFKAPFTRRFSEDDEFGEPDCQPMNESSKFTVACAQLIDPELTIPVVKNAMTEFIKEQRTQKTPK